MDRKEPLARHRGSSAVILPKILGRSQEFVVKLEGWTEFASSSVEVHIGVTSPASYLSFRPLRTQLDAAGSGSVTVPQGFDLEMLWGVHVAHLTCGEGALIPENIPASLLNWGGPALSDGEIQLVQQGLSSENEVLYNSAVGDAADPSNRLHRAVTLLTGVLTTQHAIYPGLITIPLDERPVDREHLELLNGFLRKLALPVSVDPEMWSSAKSGRYPTTAVLIPQIWAPTFEDAHRVAVDMIEKLQLVLSINRLAKASPVALIVEQRQPDDSSRSRVYPFDTYYGGNLAGGPIAGEAVQQLAAEFVGLGSDPFVRLGAGLFAEALAETNEDFGFFKHWSVLETFSDRYGDFGAVTLISGALWPEKVGPQDPGPRVYSMVAKILASSSTSESGFSSPGSDLYELIDVLKARRNATAHYGGFDPKSPSQQKRGWYAAAMKSLGFEQEWLWAARNLNVAVLHFALADK